MILARGHGRAIRRHELTEGEREFGRPLLPVLLLGRKRLDDRTILNGIVWKFRTRVAWRDAPERYGPWATLHTRFHRWANDGTFERMLKAAQAQADAAGDTDWLVSVDSTIVGAHRHAPGARKKGGHRALGRSQGGLTSKRHRVCDAVGPPLALVLTGGNASDCTQFTAQQPRQPTINLRPVDIQAAPRGGTVLQPAEGATRSRTR
ncbi:IS5 family transposase [Streptomyces sp. NPDC059340]|uniref:IS5 family transposase n=1 Tax=Streptomyces sp. NPDC059340 TaxID=3346806 RepID=UPI003678543D